VTSSEQPILRAPTASVKSTVKELVVDSDDDSDDDSDSSEVQVTKIKVAATAIPLPIQMSKSPADSRSSILDASWAGKQPTKSAVAAAFRKVDKPVDKPVDPVMLLAQRKLSKSKKKKMKKLKRSSSEMKASDCDSTTTRSILCQHKKAHPTAPPLGRQGVREMKKKKSKKNPK
jgi:hypothetical protein